MPMSKYTYGTMRMNVSQLLHEIGLSIPGCQYNPEKQEIKEVSKNSMKYLMKSLTNDDLKQEKSEEISPSTDQHPLPQLPQELSQQLPQQLSQESKNENDTPTPLALDSTSTIKNENYLQVENPKPYHTTATLNFIPYPDHNYGQQPPLTPPAETNPLAETLTAGVVTNRKVKETKSRSLKQSDDQDGITTCICGFNHDDGFMISCDNCSSWQHIECMGIKSSKVPDKYLCHTCFPRELDIDNAKLIQAKKKENMSDGEDEEDDEGNEETASEDETNIGNKTQMYTAISNTPTRLTLFTNQTSTTPQQNTATSPQQQQQAQVKVKGRRSSRVQKRKLPDQRNTKRKARKKEKSETCEDSDLIISFNDSDSLNHFLSNHSAYEEIEENKYDGEFKNMHFNLPETVPIVDFKKAVKCHLLSDVKTNRKGLLSICDIPAGNFILEFKGVLMPLKRFAELNPILQRACPYVVYYGKIDQMPIIIDAKLCGNDARFIRRSCNPNADFQHITINGVLHVIIISQSEISKDEEITVPFDYPINSYKGYLECACGKTVEECRVKARNLPPQINIQKEDEKTLTVETTIPVNNIEVTNPTKIEIEQTVESECESLLGVDEKNEKLSREDRKLQAYLKQFEKLEKKECVKKVKEPKTPVGRTSSTEESSTVGTHTPVATTFKVAPTPIKKPVSVNKRKMSMQGKRRTRQSSCSSEPVSPVDQDGNHSNVSTPNTPIGSTNHESNRFMKSKHKKEKDAITLTLPIQHKLKHDQQSLPTPTPPGTPLLQLSPSKHYPNSTLSIDTRTLHTMLDSSSMAPVGFNNGLLQIVQHRRNVLSPSAPSSTAMFVNTTSEEKIGDITIRQTATSYPPMTSPVGIQTQRCKYYGSMKKYWLQQHTHQSSPALSSTPASSSTSSPLYSPAYHKQLTLAAALASKLSCHQFVNNMPSPDDIIFKKPSTCIPLKKRYLQKKSEVNKTEVKLNGQRRKLNLQKDNNGGKTVLNTKTKDLIQSIKNINPKGAIEYKDFKVGHVNPGKTADSFINENNKNLNIVERIEIAKSSEFKTNILEVTDKASTNENPNVMTNDRLMTNDRVTSQTNNERKINNENQKRPLDQSAEEKNSKRTKIVSEETVSSAPCVVSRSLDPFINQTNNNKDRLETQGDNNKDRLETQGDNNNDRLVTRGDTLPAPTSPSNNLIITSRAELLNNNLVVTSCLVAPSNSLVITSRVESLSSTPQASPRSSIDSNPDSEYLNGEHVTVKKKLSYKEYRNRQRSQKTHSTSSTSSTTSSNNIPPLPTNNVDVEKPPPPPSSNVEEDCSANLTIDKTAASDNKTYANFPLMVSRDDSLKSPVIPNNDMNNLSKFPILSYPNDTLNRSPSDTLSNPLNNYDVMNRSHRLSCDTLTRSTSNDSLNRSHSSDALNRTQSNDSLNRIQSNDSFSRTQGNDPMNQTQSTSSDMGSYGYEPVSPNEYDSDNESKQEDPDRFGNTIHSEITKNPFSIHNDITKNPFGKKPTNPGLLQYLSAQKYPHLVTNPLTSSNGPPIAIQPHEYSTLPNGNEHENEDDQSSTHSSMSSQSYNSVGDMTSHDKSSYHHRSYSRDQNKHSSSNREYYQQHYGSNYPSGNFHPPSNNYNPSTHFQPHTPQHRHHVPRNFHPNNYTPSHSTSSTTMSLSLPRQQQNRHNQRGYLPF